MKTLFENIFFKMGIIFVLILILLIPASMVQGLIHERMQRKQEAVDEVSGKHAHAQKVTGPVLTIPYLVKHKEKNGTETKWIKHNYHILPHHLKIDGKIDPEVRSRGLFEVIVYGSNLHFSGNFSMEDVEASGISREQFQFDKAYVTLGVNDLKGVREPIKLVLEKNTYMFDPGLISRDFIHLGLHAKTPIKDSLDSYSFDFNLALNGSEKLMFYPVGKETDVQLTSSWKDPSFTGEFLPTSRNVTKDGFKASWKILHINRSYPQAWKDDHYSVRGSLFGVKLQLPVDVYQKSMRVAKYAILFIVLTYLVFFFVEILNRVLIHPIQYILVGLALVLFYILVLAFSEQMNFDGAYLLSAFMTIALILFYCRSILHSWALALMTAAILTILYGFIFILIQIQDYALLFGSLGVFLILAVTMYFSRKIDWFEIGKQKD